MRLRFLSSNKYKIGEVRSILESVGIDIVPVSKKIEELQTTDIPALVHDKCIKAFGLVGHPLFIEHTGLYIDVLNGFPGGLTQIFWDTVRADRFAELFGNRENTMVVAQTHIGFCDGKRVHQFKGEIKGKIAPKPVGPREFQWDCIFVPDGYTDTFAIMGPEKKNEISMRRRALDAFKSFLEGQHA